VTPAGVLLDRLCRDVEAAVRWNQPIPGVRMTDEIAKPAVVAKVAKPGARFLGLIDEMHASGRRLDEHADALVEELKATERLAEQAVVEKQKQQQGLRDFIEQVRKVGEAIAGDNGAPPLSEDLNK